MSDELELKYSVSDLAAGRAWLDAHLLLNAPAAWHLERMVDRYFDTADMALRRAGYGARLRHIGQRTTLGLKSERTVSGAMHHRRELEADASVELDPARWPPSPAREVVRRVAGTARLQELFVLHQARWSRTWGLNGARFDVALDDVEVRRGGDLVGRLRNLEVELLEGDPAALKSVAERLASSPLFVPERQSKADLALALLSGNGEEPAGDPIATAGPRS